jgi:iron complex outermembrane receptor protein
VLTDTSLFRIRNASPKSKLVLSADWQAAQWSLQRAPPASAR